MDKKQNYQKDLSAIRSMMERSSRFLSLSGWSGVLAGIYALVAAYIAHVVLGFRPVETAYPAGMTAFTDQLGVIVLAVVLLLISVGTAVLLSYRRAVKRKEKIWNATSRRLFAGMAVPLVTGGVLVMVFIARGLTAFLAPITLIFYGLALYDAGNFTYKEVRYLGLIQVGLGLAGSCLPACGMLFWAAGFGLMHIVYGIYIHICYQR